MRRQKEISQKAEGRKRQKAEGNKAEEGKRQKEEGQSEKNLDVET